MLHAAQDRQHMASVLGGLSMGVAACTCICLACYRMAEAVDEDDRAKRIKRQRRRFAAAASAFSLK